MRSLTHWLGTFSLLPRLPKRTTSSTVKSLYPEEVFHGLMHSETARSARSGHPCRILLVYCTNAEGLVVPMESVLADKAISVLSVSVRDTDYIGWYRQGRILGVLLTGLRPEAGGEGCEQLKTRVMEGLRHVLTFSDDHSIQIRVLEPSELAALERQLGVKRRM